MLSNKIRQNRKEEKWINFKEIFLTITSMALSSHGKIWKILCVSAHGKEVGLELQGSDFLRLRRSSIQQGLAVP